MYPGADGNEMTRIQNKYETKRREDLQNLMRWARQSPQTIGSPSLTVNADECWRISAHGLPHFLAQKNRWTSLLGSTEDNQI